MNALHHQVVEAGVFADAEVDRSPTGTGVSARLALHHARGELAAGAVIGRIFADAVDPQ